MITSNPVKTFIAAGGLDPSAGAGLAADMAAASACGVIALPVATALTVQNSHTATASYPVDQMIVAAQLRAVYDDFRPEVMKIGLVGSATTAAGLAEFARDKGLTLVVDPVLRASSGLALADPPTEAAIRDALVPNAFVLTPNTAEAAALTGIEIVSLADAARAARRLYEAGAANVLVTGGHIKTGDEVIDTLYNENGVTTLASARLPGSVRGTGCGLAAALAAHLARGDTIRAAIDAARSYVAEMIAQAVQAGKGALQGRPAGI